MVEPALLKGTSSQGASYRQKLFNSEIFTRVLDFFDERQLLEMREVSAKLSDEVIPRCFKRFKIELPNEGDEIDMNDTGFLNKMRHARKMEIRNVCGTEAHL
jgi:hypothetical protein